MKQLFIVTITEKTGIGDLTNRLNYLIEGFNATDAFRRFTEATGVGDSMVEIFVSSYEFMKENSPNHPILIY